MMGCWDCERDRAQPDEVTWGGQGDWSNREALLLHEEVADALTMVAGDAAVALLPDFEVERVCPD